MKRSKQEREYKRWLKQDAKRRLAKARKPKPIAAVLPEPRVIT